jgi:hypothetical protein
MMLSRILSAIAQAGFKIYLVIVLTSAALFMVASVVWAIRGVVLFIVGDMK